MISRKVLFAIVFLASFVTKSYCEDGDDDASDGNSTIAIVVIFGFLGSLVAVLGGVWKCKKKAQARQ